MEKECIHEKMEGNMKGSTNLIKNTDKEYIAGLMEEAIKEDGDVESSTE